MIRLRIKNVYGVSETLGGLQMQITCYYVVTVNKHGIWLDLICRETSIVTYFYSTWEEMFGSYTWADVCADDEPLRVRAAFV